MAQVRLTLLNGQQWKCPGGVNSVTLTAVPPLETMQPYSQSMYDIYGNITGMGTNAAGQLGTNDLVSRSTPTVLTGGLTSSRFGVTYSGANNAFIVQSGGSIYGWGAGTQGQLGNNAALNASTATFINAVTLQYHSVYHTNACTYGLTTIGKLYAWGSNILSQLGIGTSTNVSTPTAVLGLPSTPVQYVVPCGTGATAIMQGGAAYSWGYNITGEMGIGTHVQTSSAALVLGNITWAKMWPGVDGTGNAYMIGLSTSGVAYGWGSNANGQLGTGDVVSRSSPVVVLGGLTFIDIMTGINGTTMGLTASGQIYCWGNNAYGQCGQGGASGSVASYSSPVLVVGSAVFTQMIQSVDGNTNHALTTAGVAYGWGRNPAGGLGNNDGSGANQSSPVLVVGGYSYAQLYPMANNGATCSVMGVTGNGNIYTWGYNGDGGLGVGDVVNRSTPTLITTAALRAQPRQTLQLQVPVTPGTTYTPFCNGLNATFGNTLVGYGPYSNYVLTYNV